jgi:phage baseplate assembly protein W
MRGMNRETGQELQGFDHLKQSIADILTTPVGSRVWRRDYGSRLPQLVDRPINQSLIAELVAATAEALDRWEPRLKLEQVRIVSASSGGQVELNLVGYYIPDGKKITLEGIVV